MKILVTGGAGFIGHNLALYLKKRGYDVIVVDNMENTTPRALSKLYNAEIPVLQGDVRNKFFMGSIVKNIDIVIHTAAYISVDESFEKPREYIDNNAGGTAVVASTSLKQGKPMIYISSASVYGNPVKTPISEEHPLNPLSPYGLSKLMGEKIVEFYGRYGLKYVVVRPFNVYGPGQSNTYAGVITKFITRACNKQPLLIHGDGLQTRDFIHVDDLSRLLEQVIEKQPYGMILNAGTGCPTRIIDLARLVIKLVGGDVDLEYTPPRPGDIRDSWADISRAREILGYKPQITLEQGLKTIIPELCSESV